MDWFLERLQQANPTLDYQDLLTHNDDFKKLLGEKIIKHSQTLESVTCDFCDEEHFVSPFRNSKNEIVLSCSGSRRVITPDELKVWTISEATLRENVKSKKPIIDRASFEKTLFASKISGQNNKSNELYVTNIDGKYYFEGNLIYIKSKNAQYTIIFDVVYSLKPQGGKVEYKKIIEQCGKRKKVVDKKAILRALTGKDANLFKYVKDIRQEPAFGISLFVAMQDGKEIEFNNKK